MPDPFQVNGLSLGHSRTIVLLGLLAATIVMILSACAVPASSTPESSAPGCTIPSPSPTETSPTPTETSPTPTETSPTPTETSPTPTETTLTPSPGTTSATPSPSDDTTVTVLPSPGVTTATGLPTGVAAGGGPYVGAGPFGVGDPLRPGVLWLASAALTAMGLIALLRLRAIRS